MLLADEHHQFRAMVRDYVEREINPHIPEWEEAGMMPLHDIFTSMGKLGLLGLGYDSAVGGQGADHIFDQWPTPYGECSTAVAVEGTVTGLGRAATEETIVVVDLEVAQDCFDDISTGDLWPADVATCPVEE